MRVSANGRVRHRVAEWRTICERLAQSGLGVAEFYAREAITESSFKKWYWRSQSAAISKGKFIELQPPQAAVEYWELDLPNEARLRLRG